MEFRITRAYSPAESVKARKPFQWELVTAENEALASSPNRFESEEAARQNIARAKKAFQAVRFAKVVVEE